MNLGRMKDALPPESPRHGGVVTDWELVDESPGVRLVREVSWVVERADAAGVWEGLSYADEDAARAAFEKGDEDDA